MTTLKLRHTSGVLITLLALFTTVQVTSAYYDPSLQRWVNIDPGHEGGGNNLYAFVRGDPQNQIDYLGLRSCKEICADADKDPKLIVQNGRASMGGVVCDSDGTKCPCAFDFPVPGAGGDFYHVGECPALDDILAKHEKEAHFDDTHCKPGAGLCRAVDNPGVDSNKADCSQWRKDMSRLWDALFNSKGQNDGRCAKVLWSVYELTEENYRTKCAGK
jgi:uncharacterized protein RhaS with RHS repeats